MGLFSYVSSFFQPSPIKQQSASPFVQGPMSTGKNSFYFPSASQSFNPIPSQNAQISYPGGGYSVQAQKQAGGGGSVGTPQALTQVQSPAQSNSMPSFDTGPSDEELNKIYQPQADLLSSLIAQAPGQQAAQQALIDQRNQTSLNELQGQADIQNQALANQEVQANQVSDQGKADAARLFNELSQYYNARFGGGSSAGPAAQELLGRATSENFGRVQQNLENTLRDINTRKNEVLTYVRDTKSKLKDDYNAAVLDLQNQFRQYIQGLEGNRAMLESDKAAKRYEALQQRSNAINQLQSWVYQNQVQLDNWQKQQELSLKYKLQSIPTAYSQSELDQYFAPQRQAAANIYKDAAPGVSTNAQGVNTRSNYYGGRIKGYNQYGQPIYE